MFGVLLTCGLHPRELLQEYSIQQIGMMAAMATEHRVDMLDGILGPVVTMLGGEYNPGKVASESISTVEGGGQKKRRGPPPRRGGKAPRGRTLVLSDVTEGGQEDALMGALLRASHQGVRGAGVSLQDVKVSTGDDPPG